MISDSKKKISKFQRFVFKRRGSTQKIQKTNVGKEVLYSSDWSVDTFSSASNRVLGIEMFGDDVDRCDSVGVEKDT